MPRTIKSAKDKYFIIWAYLENYYLNLQVAIINSFSGSFETTILSPKDYVKYNMRWIEKEDGVFFLSVRTEKSNTGT